MAKLIPTITLENGNSYPIRRTRQILLDVEEMQGKSSLTDEETKAYAMLQDKYARLEKLANRVAELEEKYFESFADEDKEIYDRANQAYNALLEETINFELSTNGLTAKIQKDTLNKVEVIIINALCYNEMGETIRSRDEATKIWCNFVDEKGKESASEWALYAFNYLTGADEGNDNDPFVNQAKAKKLQKMNMRKGINAVN